MHKQKFRIIIPHTLHSDKIGEKIRTETVSSKFDHSPSSLHLLTDSDSIPLQVDFEWIPREVLKQNEKSPKPSSPKPRKAKKVD